MAETIFGSTITLSTARVVPVRWIGEQHVREDLGFIPSFADWVKTIRPEPWMGHGQRKRPHAARGNPATARAVAGCCLEKREMPGDGEPTRSAL